MFEQYKLPYDYNALEPVIDALTRSEAPADSW